MNEVKKNKETYKEKENESLKHETTEKKTNQNEASVQK